MGIQNSSKFNFISNQSHINPKTKTKNSKTLRFTQTAREMNQSQEKTCWGKRQASSRGKQVSSRDWLWHHRQSGFREHWDSETKSAQLGIRVRAAPKRFRADDPFDAHDPRRFWRRRKETRRTRSPELELELQL